MDTAYEIPKEDTRHEREFSNPMGGRIPLLLLARFQVVDADIRSLTESGWIGKHNSRPCSIDCSDLCMPNLVLYEWQKKKTLCPHIFLFRLEEYSFLAYL